jgi:hypothetical protein
VLCGPGAAEHGYGTPHLSANGRAHGPSPRLCQRQIITPRGLLADLVSWTMGGCCTEGGASVGRTAVSRQAEEVLRHELQTGEHVAGSAEVTSDPSRWAAAAFLALAIAVTAVGLVSLFGLLPGPPAGGFAAPLLPLGILFLPRPMFVVVTNQRLIGLRLSRFRRAPRQLAFAVPLAEVRIVKYRPGKYASSIQCEIPGHKRTRLNFGRAGRKDLDKVEEALARAGAFAKLDPPWPAAANS